MTYNLSYVGRKMIARKIYDKKIGVCEHYSLLYNTFLTSQVIKVDKFSGYALANEEKEKDNDKNKNNPNTLHDNRHACSLALIKGVWVPLDATWNLFEKNVLLTHIFETYGNYSISTTSNSNKIKNEITKIIIKYVQS